MILPGNETFVDLPIVRFHYPHHLGWSAWKKQKKMWLTWIFVSVKSLDFSSKIPLSPCIQALKNVIPMNEGTLKWLVYFMENPIFKWMRTGYIPL